MKIIIQGREYAFLQANKASLTQLLILKRQSGLSLGDIETGMSTIGELIESGATPDELGRAIFSDEGAMAAFAASIWLTRWQAGDRLDFEAASDFPLAEMELVPEPGDEVPVTDPPTPLP